MTAGRLRRATALALLLVLAAPAAGAAQDPSTTPADKAAEASRGRAASTLTAKNVDTDLTVPESPAFTALGLSPETVVRPTTPREFATALLNGVDQKGHLQTGVALDAAPYLVFAGSGLTLHDYRTSTLTRILSRTVVSFATTRGATSDDESVKLAVGLHSTLYDSQDPRMNTKLLDCYATFPVFRPRVPTGANPSAVAEIEAENEKNRQAHEAALKVAVDACRTRFKLPDRWNGTSWIVAIAPTWVSATGLAKDIDGGSLGVWTSVSYGFDSVPKLRDSAQIIAHARYLSNEVVVDKTLQGGQEIRDTTFAGGRVRAGTNTFNFSFEASWLRTSSAGRPDDTAARLAFAAERRLAENLWLTVSFGGDKGVDKGPKNGMALLSAFKWGIAKNPALSPVQVAKLGQ